MATQRVLIIATAGGLAERIWSDLQRWGDARATDRIVEWSPEQWPCKTRHEVDAFVERIVRSGLFPPILYRSEYVDCWSMGDAFTGGMTKLGSGACLQLLTRDHEVCANWFDSTEEVVPNPNAVSETVQLCDRIDEAIHAWSEVCGRRLVVLVRSVLGVLWTDEEVKVSLKTIPDWWEGS